MIGMFVNTVPLRFSPNGQFSFLDFVKDTNQKVLKYFENQDYPYEELINELKIKRDASRNTLFDVMFVFQNYQRFELETGELKFERYVSDHVKSKFDLTLNVVKLEKELYLNFEYSKDLFEEETVQNFIAYFSRITEAVSTNPNIGLSDLDIISDEERIQLLEEFNNTHAATVPEQTIVELFEDQVFQTPDNTALVVGSQKVTYRQLNELADAVASKILQVSSEGAAIGLLFSPSIEMLAGILGVLKTGGYYIPLSPEAPSERNKYILEDSSAKLLLSHQEALNKVDRSSLGLQENQVIEIEMAELCDLEEDASIVRRTPDDRI